MDAVNTWDVAIFAACSYIALVSLVRLMITRRNALAEELEREIMAQRRQDQQAAERKKQDEAARAPRPGKVA